MDKKQLSVNLSRRDLLAVMGAGVSAAALAGCSSKSSDDDVFMYSDDLKMDKDMKYATSTGPYNCGSRCAHKLHIKNGRIVKITSEGDIPRAGIDGFTADEHDEFVNLSFSEPAQERGCVRCYGYIRQVYQPDRLKYPLIQEGKKGDITTFRRATWEEALALVGKKVKAAYDRRSELGYVPIFLYRGFSYFTSAAVALQAKGDYNSRFLKAHTNKSTGSADSAKMECVGITSLNNSRHDKFNSDFVLIWAQDSSRTAYWQNNNHWHLTKIREHDIPTVCIAANHNDIASVVATGASVKYGKFLGYEVNLSAPYIDRSTVVQTGPVTEHKIPKWVPCRPATDGALAAAMCYVIYKRNLLDWDFVDAHTFGFIHGQEIISRSTGSVTGESFIGRKICYPADQNDPTLGDTAKKGDPFFGKTMKVPAGYSFEEYLLSLENPTNHPTLPGWTPSFKSLTTETEKYGEVLAYAGRLTGIKPEIIESLAIKYARPLDVQKQETLHEGSKQMCWGRTFFEQGGGPNRAFNGTEWLWITLGMTAICGHSDKRGGGYGMSYFSQPDDNLYGPIPSFQALLQMSPYAETTSILVPMTGYHNIIMRGRDQRSRKRLIEDVRFQTSGHDGTGANVIDLSSVPADKPLLEVDVLMAMDKCNHFNINANINKSAKAMIDAEEIRGKDVFVICSDVFMTTACQHASVVFPLDSHFERGDYFTLTFEGPALHRRTKVIDRMYDTRTLDETFYLLSKAIEDQTKFGVNLTPPAEPTNHEAVMAELEASYYGLVEPHFPYKEKVKPDFVAPSFEDFIDPSKTYLPGVPSGKIPYITPPDRSIIGLHDCETKLEALDTSSGRINFFSMLWYLRPGEFATASGIANGYPEWKEYTTGLFRAPCLNDDSSLDTTKDSTGRPVYVSGWRTPTARYISAPQGYEHFFADKDLAEFTGYKSPISGNTYPLLYMTNKARNRGHTVFDNVAIIKDQFIQCVKMNPVDAAARGINEGDLVYVYNDRGCTKIPAHLTNVILPGVISVEHGAWYRKSDETTTVYLDIENTGVYKPYQMPVDIGGAENVLTDDHFTHDPLFLDTAMAAQSGPCEVSKYKPA